jgi:hypothetical protein
MLKLKKNIGPKCLKFQSVAACLVCVVFRTDMKTDTFDRKKDLSTITEAW